MSITEREKIKTLVLKLRPLAAQLLEQHATDAFGVFGGFTVTPDGKPS